jgi:CO/xanthine dehydrogenase FAD-binding subunit
LRVAAAETILEGKPISAAAIETAAEAMVDTITAADDLHADEVNRRDIAATLTQRMLRLRPRWSGDGGVIARCIRST